MSPATVSRRGLLLAGGGVVAAGGAVGVAALDRAKHTEVPLYSETVAFSAPGVRQLVPAGRAEALVPDTRVLQAGPYRSRLVEDEQEWLEGCAPWALRVRDDGLLRSALLDLRALTADLPVAVAGWSPRWRYAWPRDVAFVAAALARLGRPEAAVAQLAFLAGVQRPDGWFEARYEIHTGRAPDERVPQLDGSGWVLWAAAQVVLHAPDRAAALLAPLRPMLVRSARRLLASRDPGTGLPPPSSDYWELVEDRLTLGTAAAVLAGLYAAGDALFAVGEMALRDRTTAAAAQLAEQVREHFGPLGYPRLLGGNVPDAAVTFLVAPIGAPDASLEVLQAVDRAETALARPAGGLAPGAGWKDDGISWTPETALFAAAWAATGFRTKAEHLLGWLGRHRTDAGSFPEKVLHDGRPAAVAPLAWTAALVVIARHELVRA
ncbi:hypothetical protein [Phycicoccus sonneratiae]|uniref:Glycoside hydrolase family 15 n=1 Tax=Phycicoccus sonneratiae TaxID=2807628 RepID=A0ABS2CL64_9MICO|nr:hypothetical protein [Phycicoccus sonneraticus]MBM6400617.1 hypothetical protein [Phycicoccus sonneraticus]